MFRVRPRALAPAAIVILTACADILSVDNTSDPQIEQIFATAASIEQTLRASFQSCHNALHTSAEGQLLPQMAVLSLEGYSILNNVGLGVRVGVPRIPIANALGTLSIFPDFAQLSTGGRTTANAVNALDRLIARGLTLGTAAQNRRGRAFGFFSIGCHQGWLAMTYDSAAIVTPGLASDFIPPLSGAADVMRAAIAMLDSAIALASDPAALGSGGFPLPPEWVSGNTLSRDDFVRVVRSLRARFRAGVARTPAERAAVDWPAVIADAENGVTNDFMLTVGAAIGWVAQSITQSSLYINMAPWYYGMADVSGAYDAWLARPMEQRDFFLVVTPDRRWPQGTTRAQQQADSTTTGTSISATPYVANRTGPDIVGHPWGVSYYTFNRLRYIRSAGNTGPFPSLTRAELNLLAAEGYLRAGNIAAAAAKIDQSRVGRGQLPALTGSVSSVDDPVPGGANCVPRVPSPPSFTSTSCGRIWEAMKWEKRMETAFTGYGQWFFDSRGWGDLVEGTAIEFPVPYQELDARRKPYYSLGGGLRSSALRGTYGF